jgi:uncharacterized protein (TIGR03435 family)
MKKRSTAIALCGIMAATGGLLAQTTPAFEVASVKPSVAPPTTAFIQLQRGRVVIQGLPLRTILAWAYQLRPDDERLVGAPDWIRTERFDIDAKAPEGVIGLGTINPVGPPSPGLLILRAILAERFELKMHTEVREMPVYALVNANSGGRLGPKLIRSTTTEAECQRIGADRLAGRASGPPPPPGAPWPCAWLGFRNRLLYSALPLEELASHLSGQMQRVVVDRTGLTGRFDFDFTWTPDQLPPPDAPERIVVGGTEINLTSGVKIDPNGAGLLTALREQLGLKLESTRAPVEVFVIDDVRRPTPN